MTEDAVTEGNEGAEGAAWLMGMKELDDDVFGKKDEEVERRATFANKVVSTEASAYEQMAQTMVNNQNGNRVRSDVPSPNSFHTPWSS